MIAVSLLVFAGSVAVAQSTNALGDRSLTAADELSDALLLMSAGGDAAAGAAALESLAKTRLDADDPLRGDVLFWLGHTRWRAGDLAGARESLRDALRTGVCPSRCTDLLGRIDLEASSVHTLPVRWTFSEPESAVFHPWREQEFGTTRVDEAGCDAGPCLAWTTRSGGREADRLVVGVGAGVPVVEVAFLVRFEPGQIGAAGRLGVVAVDATGTRFESEPATFVAGPPAQVEVDVRSLVDEQGHHPVSGAVRELWIVDTTEGPVHQWWIDDLELR